LKGLKRTTRRDAVRGGKALSTALLKVPGKKKKDCLKKVTPPSECRKTRGIRRIGYGNKTIDSQELGYLLTQKSEKMPYGYLAIRKQREA